MPTAHVRHGLGRLKLGFAAAQGLLRPLALGDVQRRADIADKFPRSINERVGAVDRLRRTLPSGHAIRSCES